MKTIEGDLLAVPDGMICQQVNCKGVMGAGLAKAIRAKWPAVYTQYHQAYEQGRLILGEVIWVPVISDKQQILWVANICGQYNYGHKGLYTTYPALQAGFRHVAANLYAWRKETGKEDLQAYVPWRIGCNLAGGDWDIVQHILEEILPDAVIVKHPSAS